MNSTPQHGNLSGSRLDTAFACGGESILNKVVEGVHDGLRAAVYSRNRRPACARRTRVSHVVLVPDGLAARVRATA